MKGNIDIPITLNKIRVVKRIGPYFPREFHPILNNSLVITERIIRAHGMIEFVKHQDMEYISESIPIENGKQRLNHISNAIEDELQQGDIGDIGMTLETVLKINRLKTMLAALAPILSQPDILNSPDGLLKLADILMDGKTDGEKDKLLDMINMLKMIKDESPSE